MSKSLLVLLIAYTCNMVKKNALQISKYPLVQPYRTSEVFMSLVPLTITGFMYIQTVNFNAAGTVICHCMLIVNRV